jgi:magnesium chelatase subunit D
VRDSTGRRSETESYSGRYTGSRAPHGKPRSIAIDATVRTAARNGSVTEDGNLSIKDTDVMEKVYQRRTGVTIVFLVDASGSMGARKRMSAVKGAMLSILTDAYQKRDRVALVSFRGPGAEILVPPTNSVELAKRRMEVMPTGGKTPLAKGLAVAERLLMNERVKRPKDLYLLVVVSDGRGNIPLIKDNDPTDDSLKMCISIRENRFRSLFLDTEQGMIKLGLGKKMSDALGAKYMKLDDIGSDAISKAAKNATQV